MVVLALLVVVVGQAVLASGQVRMSALDQRLQIAQEQHRELELRISRLETPARIVGSATGQQHMVRSHVTQLPSVSLNTPLAAPILTPAPAPSPTTTTTAPTTTTTTTPTGGQ